MLGGICRDRSVSSSKDPSGASLEGCFISGTKSIFVVEPLAMRNTLSRLPSSEVSKSFGTNLLLTYLPVFFILLHFHTVGFTIRSEAVLSCLAIISGLFSLRKKGKGGNNLYLLLDRSYIIRQLELGINPFSFVVESLI